MKKSKAVNSYKRSFNASSSQGFQIDPWDIISKSAMSRGFVRDGIHKLRETNHLFSFTYCLYLAHL